MIYNKSFDNLKLYELVITMFSESGASFHRTTSATSEMWHRFIEDTSPLRPPVLHPGEEVAWEPAEDQNKD